MMGLAPKVYRSLSLLSVFLVSAGCSFFLSLDAEPILTVMPSDSHTTIVGIALKSSSGMPIPTRRVYFLKLDDTSEDILRGRILPATHYSGGYAFLVNAEPGRYAAMGYTLGPSAIKVCCEHTVFFDRALITRLTRTIAPGTVTLLADIAIDKAAIRQDSVCDDVQQHYFKELEGKDLNTALESSRFLGLQRPLPQMSGSLHHENDHYLSLSKFERTLSAILPKAWEPWINNSKRQGGPVSVTTGA